MQNSNYLSDSKMIDIVFRERDARAGTRTIFPGGAICAESYLKGSGDGAPSSVERRREKLLGSDSPFVKG